LLRRIISGGLTVLLALLTTASVQAATPPAPHGRAALLIDGITGQILYQSNGAEKNFPASTTKLLTALVALEHGKLNQMIRVSDKAVDQPPDSTSCSLNRGEEQSLENLLYGLLLVSGNDCATAIAEGVGGGNEGQFVTWMNETAKRVGATHSHFANPSGLHQSNHYTTAYDLAMIAKAAFDNPTLLKISGVREFPWPGKSEKNGLYYNHNQMLFTYEGTVGGKNGYTEEAGLTLVTSANKNGRALIGVVLGEKYSAEQYGDMEDLLNFGFTQFEQKPVVTTGGNIGTVGVQNGKGKSVPAIALSDYSVSVPKGGSSTVTTQLHLNESVSAPVTNNQKLGTLDVLDGDRVLASVPVVAQLAVAYDPFTTQNILHWFLLIVKRLAFALTGLLLFRILVKLVRRALRRSRRYQSALRRRPNPSQQVMSVSRSRQR
jgi:D-alanyl-D-alanine carboxypeptidase (penicillin-binding protein 5/6)